MKTLIALIICLAFAATIGTVIILVNAQEVPKVNGEALQEEIDRLQTMDSVEQNDINSLFNNLVSDCIKYDPDNKDTIEGCQVAVYVALGLEIEKELGIDMETDNVLSGGAPKIIKR